MTKGFEMGIGFSGEFSPGILPRRPPADKRGML
jgi:hypothetical protein